MPPAPSTGAHAELGVVRHGDGPLRAEERVELDDGDARPDGLERLPDPDVVAVDVDAEHVELAGEPVAAHQLVDALAGDPRVRGRHQGGAEAGTDAAQRLLAAVDHEAAEAELPDQEAGVAAVGPAADLDAAPG